MNEVTLMKDLIAQVPGLAVAVVMLWFFLRYQTSRDVGFREIIGEMHRDNLGARDRSDEIISRNTAMMAEHTAMAQQNIRFLERFTEVIQGRGGRER